MLSSMCNEKSYNDDHTLPSPMLRAQSAAATTKSAYLAVLLARVAQQVRSTSTEMTGDDI